MPLRFSLNSNFLLSSKTRPSSSKFLPDSSKFFSTSKKFEEQILFYRSIASSSQNQDKSLLQEDKIKRILIFHGILGSSDNWLPVVNRLAKKVVINDCDHKVFNNYNDNNAESKYTDTLYSKYTNLTKNSKKININKISRDNNVPKEYILVDARNHGKSFWNPDCSYKAMVEDSMKVLEEVSPSVFSGQTKIGLIGHSMGGKVAMLFALQYPELVSDLVVVDISPRSYINNENYFYLYSLIGKLRGLQLNSSSSRGDEEIKVIDKGFSRGDIEKRLMEKRNSHDKWDRQVDSEMIHNVETRQFVLKSLDRDEFGHFTWSLNLEALQSSLKELSKWELFENNSIHIQSLPIQVPTLFIKGI